MPDQPISSSCLRTRDKALQEKHQKELAVVERKVNKLKWANRDTLNQLFDANNRGHNLAVAIGFKDIYHALSVVLSHPKTSYIVNIERGKALDEEALQRTAENAALKDELDKMREERDVLKSELDARRENTKADDKILKQPPDARNPHDVASPSKTNVHRLCLELATLRSRYDALVDVRERSVARYKLDYKKWNAFKVWLFHDDASDRKSKLESGDKSPEEEKKQNTANVLRKRKMFLAMGPNVVPFAADNLDANSAADLKGTDSNKENKRTPHDDKERLAVATADSSSRQVASDATGWVPLAPHPLNKPKSSHMSPPPPSVSNHNASRETRKERSSPPSTLKRRHPGKTLGRETLPGSSDTEDESQVPDAAYLASVSAVPVVLHPSASASALSKPAPPETDRCHVDAGPPHNATHDEQRPRKIRRVSPHADDALTESASSRRDVGGWVMFTSEHKTPRGKGKGKEKEVTVFATPAAPNTNKLLNDYSTYKGRGRYAMDISTADNTINALYAIDPKRNGGLDFQFDEVVRGRDDRKKMNAGDCECCREYYEAVGPLPKRLQQPLWRSPPNTPVKHQPCQQRQPQADSTRTRAPPVSNSTSVDAEFDASHQQAISDHKQAISRHRHHWARASTPPDYWNIGFPSTQEAADINKRAKEMHKAKRDSVEGEIKRGAGKYKRR